MTTSQSFLLLNDEQNPVLSDSIEFIYVNYFKDLDLMASLRSLKTLLAKCCISATVHIVDNSFCEKGVQSSRILLCSILELNSSFFNVQYHASDTNIGFGRACNKAARLCRNPVFAIVNCDTSFDNSDPASFKNFVANLDKANVVIAGPKVVDDLGFLHASCFSFDPISILFKPVRHVRKISKRCKALFPKYNYFKLLIDRITYEGMDKSIPCNVDWVSGCFMLISKKFFDQVSGFDDRYFLYFEDVDLCRKARQVRGNVLFDPRFEIIHKAEHASSKTNGIVRSLVLNSAARHHIASWLKYCLKWKYDFFEKFSNVIRYKLGNSRRPKSTLGYGLEFSVFEVDPYLNKPTNKD